MIGNIIFIIILLLLLAEIATTHSNFRAKRNYGKHELWRKAYLWAWGLGLPLAVSSFYMKYSATGNHGQKYTLIGIPFVAAAFDDKGADYASFLTPVLMGLNAVFWLLVPQLVMWIWKITIKKEKAA
jgi:hypothetical protein